MTRSSAVLLRVVPIAGWAFLGWGVRATARHELPESTALRAMLWIDGILSVVLHAAQIPAASRTLTPCGYSTMKTTVLTMIFGATRYRTLPVAGAR